MTDGTDDITQSPEEEKRSYAALGTVLMLVIVIIVILLLWRSCDTGERSEGATGGGGVVTSVSDLERVDGAVAVWLRPDATIDEVLARNGLAASTASDLGRGTYIVVIAEETDAEALVDRLKADPGLYDAGFLYSED